MKKVITISREFGSGGRTIAKMLADKLGYDYYDKEIIEHVHEHTGFSKDFIEEQGEYAPSKSMLSYVFIGRDDNGISINDRIWNAQRKIIVDVASKGNCVIVGRCADYILKDRDDVLNVFIHAKEEFKVQRLLENYGDIGEEPTKRLKDKDKKRAINYKYYTDSEWGAYDNYHISLDSGLIGIEKCVEILADIAKMD